MFYVEACEENVDCVGKYVSIMDSEIHDKGGKGTSQIKQFLY